jgi:hypothetical protein
MKTAYHNFYSVTKRENTACSRKHFETHSTDVQQSVIVLKAINCFLRNTGPVSLLSSIACPIGKK